MSCGGLPDDKFPELPFHPSSAPWPAEIIDGHDTLKAAHISASRALNLDEPDPNRLRHYEKQIKTVMTSTLQALGASKNPSLPEYYIGAVADTI